LLFGTAVGFGGAVALGYKATAYSLPSDFKRFHQRVAPEGAFYPPFSMLENLALSRWKPGMTVVVIGGNSILNGSGQTESELWSLRLQELLGPSYAVINVAFSGAYPSEGGALVAEVLLRRHIPVIYVANDGPGPVARAYEGIYHYLYWDASYKDRLLPNPPREAELGRREHMASARAIMDPQQLAGRFDAILRFEELWHYVTYRDFSTVWTIVSRDAFWQPKDRIPDWGVTAPPLAERFRDYPETEMAITRGFSESFAEPDGAGGWRPTLGPIAQTAADIDEIFIPPLRARMLMILSQNCRFYRDQLTPPEQARDRFVFATYQQLWQQHGVACLTAGTDFDPADYSDRTHLSASGGRKLAGLVAGEIRKFPAP